MRPIRKLYLQNSSGDRWSFNGAGGSYATNLSGLGVTLSPTYADLSGGFFLPVGGDSEPQGTIAFTAVFVGAAYSLYQSFANWLSAAESLTLCYAPVGDQEYWRDVEVNFAQKGELNEVGWLEVPCSFFALTPWYKPVPSSLSLLNSGADESKRYSYVYTDDLAYGTDSSSSLSGTIVGQGHVPGALDLVYYGAIVNPTIRLVGSVSGKTYGVCSVTATLAASDRLEYSSRYRDSYIRKISSAGVATDLLDALDLRTTPFFKIPVSEPCSISIEADATFAGSADLVVYYYYRSV